MRFGYMTGALDRVPFDELVVHSCGQDGRSSLYAFLGQDGPEWTSATHWTNRFPTRTEFPEHQAGALSS